MKISKKTLSIFLTSTFISLLLLGGILYFFYCAFIEKFRYEGIKGIGIGLTVYANDYGTVPPLDQWCDKLIEEADFGPSHFWGVIDRQEGVCGYALNENLQGKIFSELDDKVVLAFEAKGPWNLSGGPELMKTSTRKKIAVVFVDGHMKFIPREDIDKLKWKP